jgi:hypothetical protein
VVSLNLIEEELKEEWRRHTFNLKTWFQLYSQFDFFNVSSLPILYFSLWFFPSDLFVLSHDKTPSITVVFKNFFSWLSPNYLYFKSQCWTCRLLWISTILTLANPGVYHVASVYPLFHSATCKLLSNVLLLHLLPNIISFTIYNPTFKYKYNH